MLATVSGGDGRVIVIGSGPPGATAALVLSKAGANVLLLEAGSERSAFGLTVRIGGFTILSKRRPLGQRTGYAATADPKAELYEDVAPGGLTNHWSCAVPRFSPDDFADAARAGEAFTWPIGYDDLAPWYDRVEPLLHIAGGTVSGRQLLAGVVRRKRTLRADWDLLKSAAEQTGRELAPMPYAYGSATTATLSGTVFNSFIRLVWPERLAGRLAARFDARVVRLEWSPKTRRVIAVVFRDGRTGVEERMECSAVVVAAGAVASAEILLASTSAEFPEGLGNTHGVLGRYLHDHPLGKLVVDLATPLSFHPPSYLTREAVERAPSLSTAACVQWSGGGILAESLLTRRPGSLPWTGFNVFGTMTPTRDNWVALDRTAAGSNGVSHKLQLHISHPPEAKVALDKARDDLSEILTRAGLKPRLRLWLIEPAGESKHYGGTCRMHASPSYGMLDRWNRMHAAPNVAVVDSAAFTTGPEKNPVLTAMALAARAADRVAQDLKTGVL
jgi:choline dehydrogenase-like flavoprotein